MKRKLIKNLMLVLTMVVLCLAVGMSASALDATGQCGDNVYWNFDETTGELVISGEGDMYSYENSNPSPFEAEDEIISVVINDGVTKVGDSAFRFCRYLNEISLPDTLETIGSYAFAFSELCQVDIPDSVKNIRQAAFLACDNLMYVTLPEQLEYIDVNLFAYCVNLLEITIPDSVEIIGAEAFYNCIVLKDVVIPEGLKTIGYGAFAHCISLEEITLPESLEKMDDAFYYCISLKEIVIPDKITTLEEQTFLLCTSLEKVTLSNNLINIGAAFPGCFELKEIVIPESVQTISDGAFYFCNKLEKVECFNKDLVFNGDTIFASEFEFTVSNEYITNRLYEYFACWAKSIIMEFGGKYWPEYIAHYEDYVETIMAIEEELYGCVNYYESIQSITDLVLYGYTHSTTESYAIANNISFDALEGSEHPDKYFAKDWTYDYDNLVRYRQCEYTNCDVKIEEALEEIKEDSDVEIVAPTNPDTDFEVDEIEKGSNNYVIIEEALTNGVEDNWEIIKAFDITMTGKDDVHTQPDGTVKVKLPNDWSKNGVYKVYRVNDDGTLTDMNAYRQGSHLVFDTDHFSVYVIVVEGAEPEAPAEPDTPATPDEEAKLSFFEKVLAWLQSVIELIFGWLKK